MLKSLHVRNYVLIDSLDIEFPEGLVIITGETGSGKSILLGALSLLLGAKADASVISAGADSCVVEALFDVDTSREMLSQALEENHVEWDDGHLLVRRVIHSSGRSRSFVNDSPVPLPFLVYISERLIDIHSQHRNMMLTDRQFQLEILDSYAGNSGRRRDCRELYRRMTQTRTALAQMEAALSRSEAEKEYNESRLKRLVAAGLREGELEELEAEQLQLSNAEQIKSDLQRCCAIFEQEDSQTSLCTSLKEAGRVLEKLEPLLPSINGLAARIEVARIELDDIFSDISDAYLRVNVSEERLAQVEERMADLYDLMHKFSCSSVKELIACREELDEALYDATSLEQKRDELLKSLTALEIQIKALSLELHEYRSKAALSFAEKVESSLHYLELDRSAFDVLVGEQPLGPLGTDTIMFRFSADGSALQDAAKCASGGELSRIMLSLKSLMASYAQMPTMIFDEIDTGVSGSVAAKMGSMICTMGETMQVFAITHLPQVAAKGNAHYLVSKSIVQGRSVTSIRRIDGRERVQEIARMLSGECITSEAVANAESLLKQ